MAEHGLHCATCGRQTLHRRREANHILWAILTLFSCGIFAIVWIIDSTKAGNSPWLCTICGSAFVPERGATIAGRPRPAQIGLSGGTFALYVAGFVVVGTLGAFAVLFIQYRREMTAGAAETAGTGSEPEKPLGNPTHDKLQAMRAAATPTRNAAKGAAARERARRYALIADNQSNDTAGRERLLIAAVKSFGGECKAPTGAVFQGPGVWELRCAEPAQGYTLTFNTDGELVSH